MAKTVKERRQRNEESLAVLSSAVRPAVVICVASVY